MNGLKNVKTYDVSVGKCTSPDEITDKLFKNFLNKPKEIKIIDKEINVEFIKQLLKLYKWTYKDLADHIGAVETTVRNWMSKGDIPDWAKLSIGYIATVEKLDRFNCYKDDDIEELKTSLQKIYDFTTLDNEENDYDEGSDGLY